MKGKSIIYTVHRKTTKPFVDLVLGRTMSKKLLVFFIATFFLIRHYLDADQWVTVASWYVGTQAVVDGCMAIMGNKKDLKDGTVKTNIETKDNSNENEVIG
jgi:hypothetical protein